MASAALADSANTHRRSIVPLTALVGAHVLFNLLVDPFQDNRFHWAIMLAGGVYYIQPILFGVWSALGPPPTVKRVPLSLAAYATVIIVPSAWRQFVNGEPVDVRFFATSFVVCVLAFAVMLLVRKFAGWRIDVPSATSNVPPAVGQFSLRNLLVFTTVCAALLATGRALTPTVTTGAFTVADALMGIGVVLMIVVPAFMAPLAVLSECLPRRVLIAIPFVWAVLTTLTVIAMRKLTNDYDWESAFFMELVQVGALLAALVSALFLRFNGYRLLRQKAA